MRTVERLFEQAALARVGPLRTPGGTVLGYMVRALEGWPPEGPFSSEPAAVRRAFEIEHDARRSRARVSSPAGTMTERKGVGR